MKLLARRVPIRFLPRGHRRNSLMAHWVDANERPLCGNRQLRLDRWAEVPASEVAEYEICRACRRRKLVENIPQSRVYTLDKPKYLGYNKLSNK